ncbi:GumC family protein [Rhodoblastus sp.]|uniref:GumC family protein n=1 Tax=Rhodoblastus sp. TaxID=1962975 RepID=UPI0025E8B226|nr:GumC family protein [Rhodoblastus sp.]
MGAREFDSEAVGGRGEIDLNGVTAALGRNKRLIAQATLGAAAAALVFCLMVSPRYMAEARILVENQESYFTSAAPEGARDASAPQDFDAEAINSQIQLLTSRDLARKAVQKLGLKGNPEFDPDASFLSSLMRPLALFGLGGRSLDQQPDDRLLTNFIDHLTVMSPSKTRVLQVEFTSRDPDLAARGANVVAELYIDLKSQAKREGAHQAAQALRPLMGSLETRVAEADAKMEAFRARTGLYESSENTSVPTQQLGEIATKLAEARAAQSEAEAKARGLRDLLKQGRLGDAGEISSNDLVRRIAEQRVAVRSQLALESRTLLPAHPLIKGLEAQLSDIETQLRAAVEKAARGQDNDARVAATRVANLTALLEEQKGAVGASNADAAQLRELQRDAKILKDQLASVAAKYQAALSRDVADSAPPDARIISRALAPSQPVFPKKLPITIFAAIAGLFFSSAYVVARELSGERARTEPKRERATIDAESEMAPARGAIKPAIAEREIAAPAAPPAAVADVSSARETAGDSTIAGLKKAVFGFGMDRAAAEKAKPESLLSRVKQAVAEYAAPAEALAPASSEPASPPKQREATTAARIESQAEPVALLAPQAKPQTDARDAAPAVAEPEPKATSDVMVKMAPRPRNAASRALVERIAAARSGGGAKVLVASAAESASACASLALARAMAREGRAILVQIDHDDASLADALALADGRDEFEEAQPGLAQLLHGEASFAEAIYRDGASRLHIIQSGGAVSDESGDLDLILDALQSTYDFVLVATGWNSEAARISADADLTVIFAEDGTARDFLHDDFAAAGARAILLAGVDSLGEIVEMAA